MPEAAAAAALILAGGGAAVGIAEYGTHLLAAASVEMAGYSSIIISWGHGDSRGN